MSEKKTEKKTPKKLTAAVVTVAVVIAILALLFRSDDCFPDPDPIPCSGVNCHAGDDEATTGEAIKDDELGGVESTS